MTLALLFILLAVLVLPFAFHHVERNLEVFLFAMGLLAALVGGAFSLHLVEEALVEPLPITLAVAGMGLLFKWTRRPAEKWIGALRKRVPPALFLFATVFLLGLFSSAITAIIASLVLVEVVSLLKYDRISEVRLVILACFSIGLGAALTPVGEPLSTIAIAKLAGEPHHAGFWFLFRHLGAWVLPGVLAFSLAALLLHGHRVRALKDTLAESEEDVRRDESYPEVAIRAMKVYLFVVALVFLGEGFKPLVDKYVVHMHPLALYWINSVSAVLDNATLAAAEISPRMSIHQIRDILMGLLLAGGMLIPGNIPNIIAAGKLGIGMKEWAKFAVPVGLCAMVVYFFLLMAIR